MECTACGLHGEYGASYCITCIAPVKVFDDSRFLKRILLIAVAVIVVVYVVGIFYTVFK